MWRAKEAVYCVLSYFTKQLVKASWHYILMTRAESLSLGDKSVNLPYSAYPSVTFSTSVVAPFNLHSLTPFPYSQKRLLRVYIDKETKG